MKLTQPEWQLMNALWEGHPASARQIVERLPKKTRWAYTTIKTMLSRLVAKKALSESKKGNVSLYAPRLTRRKARLMALRMLAGDAFEGAFGSLVHFIVEEENLSAEERRKLAELLDEKPERGRKNDRDPQRHC